MKHKEACITVTRMVIPYSGKFSWGPILMVFVDKWLSAKREISMIVQCIMGLITHVREN
jgi:hypothetical protein